MVKLVSLLFMCSQGLGNGNALASGQVSSWLNCAQRERGTEKQKPVRPLKSDEILKSEKKIFWKHIFEKNLT
jgi:hypothetical protein